MSKIVRAAADFLYPFVLIFGFYIVLHGHLTPGGGFQGGAVIATGIALMFVANHYQEILKYFKKSVFHTCEIVGLLLFASVGFIGMFQGKSFFYNWMVNARGLFGDVVGFGPNAGNLNTGGIIPLLNIAVGVEVLGALSMVIFYLLSHAAEYGEREENVR
ncbi:sodium:proton antiporter [bacterium]|nr:sodium:proton antiporter [bacterium]